MNSYVFYEFAVFLVIELDSSTVTVSVGSILMNEPEVKGFCSLTRCSVGCPCCQSLSQRQCPGWGAAMVLPLCPPNYLFLSFSLREKLKAIAQATYTHSRNLAYFVFTYKGLMALQSRLQGKKIPFHSFFAACIGGWLVFGDNNPINSQVNVLVQSFLAQKPQQMDGHVPGSGCCSLACAWRFLQLRVTLLPRFSSHRFLFWLLYTSVVEVAVCLCLRCVQCEH